MKKTTKKCKDCGKIIYASRDKMLCDDCLKKHRKNNAIAMRVCKNCGKEFLGGAKAKYCPKCKPKMKPPRKPTARPLGSIDKCQLCGKEYIVNSGKQKYCSSECAEIALKAWEHEKWKNNPNKDIVNLKKANRRSQNTKVCVYCLREFKSNTATNLCSDYCREMQKKQYRKDFIEEREKHREKVKKNL